ncbi:hypothetical protein ACQUW5_07160 [Legionella sp. CNM-1927-20]
MVRGLDVTRVEGSEPSLTSGLETKKQESRKETASNTSLDSDKTSYISPS